VLGRGHNKAVDYWAFGILVYEMQAGFSPFSDSQGIISVFCYKNLVFFVSVFFVFCILFYGVYDNNSLLSVRWSVHPYFRPFGMDGMGWWRMSCQVWDGEETVTC
jgi:serine/threonine protein kinase